MTYYFLVPRGGDIRMVYHGTYIGLNNALWAPHFALLMVRTMLRATEEGTSMADRDISKIFLNLMLSKEVKLYCGVDISNVRTE